MCPTRARKRGLPPQTPSRRGPGKAQPGPKPRWPSAVVRALLQALPVQVSRGPAITHSGTPAGASLGNAGQKPGQNEPGRASRTRLAAKAPKEALARRRIKYVVREPEQWAGHERPHHPELDPCTKSFGATTQPCLEQMPSNTSSSLSRQII